MITRNELYRLRYQLTQLGPETWEISKGNARLSVVSEGDGICPVVADCANAAIAEHIATFDPAMCLRLLNEIEVLMNGELREAA